MVSRFERTVVEASRRVRGRLGEDIIRLRSDAGVTRAELASASGVDPSFLGRIEAGRAQPSIETYARLAVALGADLSGRLYPTTGPTIRDRHQSRIAEALLAIRHPRWQAFAEIAVRSPSRGWIDLGLFNAPANVFVATEIQSELRRVEQIIRWSGEKAASVPSWEGWRYLGVVPAISQLLVVRDTRANREVARQLRRVLNTAYPSDPEEALSALSGVDAWPGSAMLWATFGRDAPAATRIVARP